MAELLLWLTFFLVVLTAAGGVSVGLAVRAINRRNRVCPHLGTAAPLSWLWSPFAGARQHRRLRRCTLAVLAAAPQPRRGRRAPAGWPALQEAARDLAYQAAEVDDRVVAAARARSSVMVKHEVAEIEGMASRLLALAQRWGGNVTWAGIDLHDRLAALEEATVEVQRLQVPA